MKFKVTGSVISHIYSIIKNTNTYDPSVNFKVIEKLGKVTSGFFMLNPSTEDRMKLLEISNRVLRSVMVKNSPYKIYDDLKDKIFRFGGTLAGDIFEELLNQLKYLLKNDIEYTQNFLKNYLKDHPGNPLKQALKANKYFFDNRFTEDELKEILK